MRQEQDGTVAAQVAKEPFLAPVRMLRLCCSTKRPPRWTSRTRSPLVEPSMPSGPIRRWSWSLTDSKRS